MHKCILSDYYEASVYFKDIYVAVFGVLLSNLFY